MTASEFGQQALITPTRRVPSGSGHDSHEAFGRYLVFRAARS
ncbi:hypothetical protein [Streptomyces sp. NPDC003660]